MEKKITQKDKAADRSCYRSSNRWWNQRSSTAA